MRKSTIVLYLATALSAGCAASTGGSNEGTAAMTKAAAVDLATLVGSSWLAQDIAGKAVAGDLKSQLQFVSADSIAGNAGCNSFKGAVKQDGGTLTIGPLATTRKMCPPAAMDQEGRFIKTLESARGARFEDARLVLLDAAGSPILRLARLE